MDIGIDWDGTVVDVHTQDWLNDTTMHPEEALRRIIKAGHRPIIHSCRANWPEGLASIKTKLSTAGILIPVWSDEGKPSCDLYIDDHGVHYGNNWGDIVQQLERRKMAPSVKARPPRRKPRREVWH